MEFQDGSKNMETTIKGTKIEDELASFFEENRLLIEKSSSAVLNKEREAAYDRFRKLGIPAKNSEDYKHLDVAPLFTREYNRLLVPKKIMFNPEDIFHCDIPSLDTYLALLLNGFYYDQQETIQALPDGVIIGSLKEASIRFPDLVSRYYNRYATFREEGLSSLNTMFAQDGMFIYIPPHTTLPKPIQIVSMMMSDEPLMSQYRNLVILDNDSEAQIIVCDHTLSPQNFLTNAVTEIHAGVHSRLNYTKMQNEHNGSYLINHRFIRQETGSSVNSAVITLHGGVVRNNMYVKLDGENCTNISSGLFLTDQGQHVDTFTWIDHASPRCTSNQFYKGILDDFSSGAFNGRIIVRPGAQKTDAYQKNNNLLLTDDAKMNAKPQLEIYADDVKCSHGATVGQLDTEALFYLRSRGIGLDEARLLLMSAFANEIIENIGAVALRERIMNLVNKRLRGEFSRCHHCAMHCC